MFLCQLCQKPGFLILNTCADCDPVLHSTYRAAIDSAVDFYTVTPEMVTSYLIVEDRKSKYFGNMGSNG